MDNIKKHQLEELKIEDIIWIIYFFIVGANLYSNYLQESNIMDTKKTPKREIKAINLTIFIIVFIIYLYFLYVAYTHLKEAKTEKQKELASLTLLGSLLFVVAGAIFIYVEYSDGNEEEIGII